LQELIKRNAEVKRVLAVVKRFAPLDANTRGLATLIVRESARSGLDPLYVAAIVKSESTFQPSARSNKHAKGLMQITPITERELTATVDLSGIKRRDLADAQYNLRLGTTYLRQLEKKFKGDRSLALVAYNWGPGHVMAALRGEKQIPRESLEYARQVLANHQSWSALG
jgi:soluble lytic murein transglycosylase-like protein